MTNEQGNRPNFTFRVVAVAALLLGSALVGAQTVQATRSPHPTYGTAAIGTLQAVTLTGGRIFYGTLVEIDPAYIVLANIYYVETAIDPKTGEPGNRLINRRANDWHAPLRMSIPIDKVLLIEQVGLESRLAKRIEEDKRMGAAPQKS